MNIPADYQDMPEVIPGFTVYDVAREYVIVINKNLSIEEQKRVYEEELERITKGLYVKEILRSAY